MMEGEKERSPLNGNRGPRMSCVRIGDEMSSYRSIFVCVCVSGAVGTAGPWSGGPCGLQRWSGFCSNALSSCCQEVMAGRKAHDGYYDGAGGVECRVPGIVNATKGRIQENMPSDLCMDCTTVGFFSSDLVVPDFPPRR